MALNCLCQRIRQQRPIFHSSLLLIGETCHNPYMGVRCLLKTFFVFLFCTSLATVANDVNNDSNVELGRRLLDFKRYDFYKRAQEQSNFFVINDIFDFDGLSTLNGSIVGNNEFLEIAFNANSLLSKNENRKNQSRTTGPSPRQIILSILKRSLKKSAKSLVSENKTVMIEFGTGGQSVDWKAYANNALKVVGDKLNHTPDFDDVVPQFHSMLLMSLQQIQTADSIDKVGHLRSIKIDSNLHITGLIFDDAEFRVHCLRNKIYHIRKISCSLEEI